MRIVLDSNVYLAAAKPESYARKQLQRSAPDGPYQVYISPEIIVEVREVLERQFFYKPKDSAHFVTMVLRYAALVQPRRRIIDVLQDVNDHVILECAVEAKAHAILTADRGLLRLKQFEGIAIIHPTMLQYLK